MSVELRFVRQMVSAVHGTDLPKIIKVLQYQQVGEDSSGYKEYGEWITVPYDETVLLGTDGKEIK
jgi:tagatose-1,6-bisphosphate aldolase